MIKRTSLDQVALADQFPLASGVAVPSGASQPDAVAVFGSQSPDGAGRRSTRALRAAGAQCQTHPKCDEYSAG
jgi:hypothetical protein